jgi:hypothetical protein
VADTRLLPLLPTSPHPSPPPRTHRAFASRFVPPLRSELFATGEVSAQDLSGLNDLSQEEQVASAALISGLALILIILGIVALVVIIVLVAATTTGVLVYKKRMFDVSAHAFEGEFFYVPLHFTRILLTI